MIPEHEVKRVWSKFETKNVSYDEFRKRYIAAASPPTQSEMMGLQLNRARVTTQKAMIDRSLRRHAK